MASSAMYGIPILPAVFAAIVLGAPAAAAAQGNLIIDGVTYSDPSGCILLGGGTHFMQNDTGSVITIYPTGQCGGSASGILTAGSSGSYTGKSVVIGG
ncbi:hypothetical protein [Nocardia arthritidis]|uniref:Uncharacterized protein n=1 Tax=Nocardia arthritidis TaxID=228602 RepID=A0A6G9YD05_9NOCA|nr:hypothetical protein [Nocardia arthritidis]QIS10893.1 hypothetical protein F5544_15045 [Nocardia arthritidis]